MNFLFLDTLGYESALRLSGHHYARLLAARGHNVLSLSASVTPFHLLARGNSESIRRRFENHRRGFVVAPGGVHHYVPLAWFPVRNVFPLNQEFALQLAERTYERDVLTRFKRMKFTPDVVSLQNMMFYPLAKKFPDAVLHYRMTDLMEGFADYPASMLAAERRVLEEADLISITSKQFAFKLAGANERKLIYAPNGVDVGHMSQPRERPVAYASIKQPIAVYVGALRAWFDWDLLKASALACSGVHFFVISPDAPRADLLQLPNFTYLPGVPYEDIPAYYQHAAVGIIPFKDSPLVAPVNPIKLFECLAAGTPVVAIEWAELREQVEAPIRLAKNAAEFSAEIQKACAEGKKIDYRPYLTKRSWEGNLDALLARIDEVRKRRKG